MKLIYCMNCHSLRDGQDKLDSTQIMAINLVNKVRGVELEITNEVCFHCRLKIGNGRAGEMLGFCKWKVRTK